MMNSLLEELVEGEVIKGETLALDATFIEAYSRRDPADDSHGLSDPEARVGRDGNTYDLDYKAHVAMDMVSDMPVAVVGASANEKRHVEELMARLPRFMHHYYTIIHPHPTFTHPSSVFVCVHVKSRGPR